jgi:hypothetical protein
MSLQAEQLVLPIIATAALGTALILPLRELRSSRAPTSTFAPGGWFGTLKRVVVDFYSIAPGIFAATSESPITEQPFDAELAMFDSHIASPDAGVSIANADSPICDIDLERPEARPAKPIFEPTSTGTTIVPRTRPHFERAVPITRAPLRAANLSLTWPAMIDGCATSLARAERHGWLRTANDDTSNEAALLAAYREEDADGRLLALQSLVRCRFSGARESLVHALRLGSDEERAFAVDGLVTLGDRASLGVATADRVDAIAARAALGYVASEKREDYAAALAPFLDDRRIEMILSLLAGVVR